MIKRVLILLMVIPGVLACNLPLLAKTEVTPVVVPSATPSSTPSPSSTSVPVSTSTPKPTQTPEVESSATATPTVIILPTKYIVQRGDTLYSISRKFGVRVDYIAWANGINDYDLIYAGQELTIPDPANPPSRPTPIPVSQSGPAAVEGKLILVRLSEQKTYAYEDGQLLQEFVVSTGLPATPTIQGEFEIYLKYDSARMTGPGYDLAGVPWTMYFRGDYGLHGTYWHENFGQPMSHGCVNLRTEDAKWLYDWAPIGTKVIVKP